MVEGDEPNGGILLISSSGFVTVTKICDLFEQDYLMLIIHTKPTMLSGSISSSVKNS